jgi:hypothetical protein
LLFDAETDEEELVICPRSISTPSSLSEHIGGLKSRQDEAPCSLPKKIVHFRNVKRRTASAVSDYYTLSILAREMNLSISLSRIAFLIP